MQLTLLAAVEDIIAHEYLPPTHYLLRAVHKTDEFALAELYYHVYSPDIIQSRDEARHEIQHTFEGAYGQLLPDLSPVTLWNDTLVGSVLTVAQAPWADTPQGLFVIEVMTHADHRRQGVARASLVWTAKHAFLSGHNTIGLRVESENTAAVALYQSLGFRIWTL